MIQQATINMRYNLGKLRNESNLKQNIIYYRRKNLSEISINLTNRCPNFCKFCIRNLHLGWDSENLYLKKEPSLKEIKNKIKKEIDSINNNRIAKFKICGYGEPILRVDILPELVSFLKKIQPTAITQISTTGWPLYHIKNGVDYFIKTAENGLDIVYLSLHSVDYKGYSKKVRPSIDAITAFNQVIDFIKLAKSLSLKVICAFVAFEDLDYKKIKEFAEKYGCEYSIREIEK